MTGTPTIGLLHPGAMGAAVGADCSAEVVWCPDGRSAATAERAEAAALTAVGSLGELVERSDIIMSVCPPGEALAVADTIAAIGFDGIYVDANAVAPATARAVGERFDRFVDGGIVGPPPRHAGTTRCYLSGPEAATVAAPWANGVLDVRVIDGGAGAASALKMAYATWTKVAAALLLDVRALARAEGVEDDLLAEWAISQPDAEARSVSTAAGVAPKAWRFVGEMEQIAAAFADAGLPDGFAVGAAEVYARLERFKDGTDVGFDEVLADLLSRR